MTLGELQNPWLRGWPRYRVDAGHEGAELLVRSRGDTPRRPGARIARNVAGLRWPLKRENCVTYPDFGYVGWSAVFCSPTRRWKPSSLDWATDHDPRRR